MEQIKEIKDRLNNVIHNGMGIDYEDLLNDIDELLKYTDAIEVKLGQESAINSMQKINISNQRDIIEEKERRISALQNKLNQTEIIKLENKEREISLDIQNKINELRSINTSIKKIEEEIIVLNDQYNFIYD